MVNYHLTPIVRLVDPLKAVKISRPNTLTRTETNQREKTLVLEGINVNKNPKLFRNKWRFKALCKTGGEKKVDL